MYLTDILQHKCSFAWKLCVVSFFFSEIPEQAKLIYGGWNQKSFFFPTGEVLTGKDNKEILWIERWVL